MTFLVTVAVDLITAVAVGVAIAVVLALRSVSRSVQLEQVPLGPIAGSVRLDQVPLDDDRPEDSRLAADQHRLLAEHIVAYRIEGPLFFAAAHRFLLEPTEIATVRVVILRLSRITSLDVTGARVLGDAISRLEKRGIIVLLSGIRPEHDDILSTLGVADHLRADHRIFAEIPTAIASARVLVGRTPQ